MKLLPLILFLCDVSQSAKILGFFPLELSSHYSVLFSLIEELSRRNHEITVVSGSNFIPPNSNYTFVPITIPMDRTILNLDYLESTPRILIGYSLCSKSLDIFNRILNTNSILGLLEEKFDVIITETFLTDIFYGLFYKLNAPIIGVATCELLSWENYMLSNPIEASYLVNAMSRSPVEMSFWHRIKNLLEISSSLTLYPIFERNAQELAEKTLGPIPALSTIIANTSLTLVNSHFSVVGSKPRAANIIQVGGIHLKQAKSLPQNLQTVLDQAKSGVIFVSFGTTVASNRLKDEREEAFIKVFSRLEQTVLWKTANTKASSVQNILASKWFPQEDILAHPNVVLFISQCGMLSLTESVNSSVPIICVPLFGDQFHLAKLVDYRKIGFSLKMNEIDSDTLEKSIREVISNYFYKRNVENLSKIFKDRPMSAMDTAVYWVEYVIRHKGAPQLKSLAKDLTWYEYQNLDIYLTLILSIGVTFVILKQFLFKKLWSSTRKSKTD